MSSQMEFVHLRDRDRCTNCGRPEDKVEELDIDHNHPRGMGGSERLSNVSLLCRRCHKAKHGEGFAPGARLRNVAMLHEEDFAWFKHFIHHMVPSMARVAGFQLQPKFNLYQEESWHLPMGDLRRGNVVLTEEDPQYHAFGQDET